MHAQLSPGEYIVYFCHTDAREFAKGQRVKMHPATDWFAMGARYGTVTRISRRLNLVSVRLDAIKHTTRVDPSVLAIIPED